MPLTHILLIVLTAAAVLGTIFLILLFLQLRRTAAEAQRTLVEVRALAKNLSELDLVVKDRVEELGETLRASKKAATGLSEATMLVTSKFLPAPAKYFPFILPVARFVMRQMKKRKEKSDGK